MEYKCEEVSKIYRKFLKREELIGLIDVNFEFQTGEIIGIVGTSRSGKSSLIDILSGKSYPSVGNINYEAKKITKVYNELGVKLNKNLSVYDNMVAFGKKEGMSELEVENRMSQLRDIFTLNKYINTKVIELTESNRVKCELAMLLLSSPRILLIDDAFAFLDNASRNEVLKCLKRLNKQERTIIIMAAPHVSDVDKIINRIIIISKNKIIYDNSLTVFKERYCKKKLFEVYLNKNISIERIEGVDVVDTGEYYYKLLFDNVEGMFAKVINLFDVNNIVDLRISEQRLSDVIENIKKDDGK